MKKLTSMSIVIAFVLVAFSTDQVLAQKRMGEKIRHEKSYEALNLTENQKNKIKEIRFTYQETEIDLKALIKKNRLEMNKITDEESVRENEIMDLIEKRSTLKAELMKSKAKMWFEIHNILDEDQKKYWKNNFGQGFDRLATRGIRFFHKRRAERNDKMHRRHFKSKLRNHKKEL